MSPSTLVAGATCHQCEKPLNPQGYCLTAECPNAISAATREAGRETAKVSVGAIAATQPRAFRASGGVD